MVFDFQKIESIFGGYFACFDPMQHIFDHTRHLVDIVIHFVQQLQCQREVLLVIDIV